MRRRFSYANVAATLALVFAMSGGALAANHYLINSTKQINPKVLKKLKGATGKAGVKGTTGATGAAGTAGAAGSPGAPGAPGPGVIARGGTTSAPSCKLTSSPTICFPSSPSIAFTPSADAQCLVVVSAQIHSGTALKPTEEGPYFRIEIKEDASEKNDGEHGYYFESTGGEESTSQERTRLLAVKAGHTYDFGVYFGSVEPEWEGKSAFYEVTYNCFA